MRNVAVKVGMPQQAPLARQALQAPPLFSGP